MNKEKNRKSELSPSETNHSSNAPDETRRFSNYTQDTLTEVLSWYGLQESGVVTSMAGQGNGDVTSSVVSSCSPLVQCEAKSVDVPLDLTHCQLKTECDTHGLTDGSMLDTGGQHSQSHKKVGMRFIFPPLSDELTLLEKAQIWVARHNYKYFVNWTEEQLKSVDSILQPVVPVTPSLYKTHMNRSEYCRNVKLKFCLEADAAWSREFRERLQKPANEGGFSGLCQAKIAAAELWRRYSENYKSHQARYPNPKNKYRQKRIDRQISNPDHLTDVKALEEREAKDDIPYKRRRRSSEYDQGRPGLNGVEVDVDDTEDVDMDDAMCSQESCCKEEYRALIESGSGYGVPGDTQDKSADRVVETAMSASKYSPRPTAIPSPSLVNGKSCTPQKAASISPCGSEVDFHHGRVSATPVSPEICNKITSSVNYDAMVSPPESASSAHNGITMSDMYLNGSQKHQQLLQQQQPEYKRSERGLSYLFPSLNDHKLSLLDKVWITVVRHKNNYFLGWQEDTLATVDPLIRPKMVVTMELYREYCHRNAMKYDSNVQFCMESPEPWAREFREKLRRAPCQGGFGSLCEVKLEAGRLWREYSGKYRMHNIVKWHMDMNTMTTSTGTAADTDGQLEQQKADVLLSPVVQHQPGQRAEPPTLQVKTESSCQSASASPAEPAVDLPGLNAGLRVDVDLTKNAIDDERAAQLSRRTSSFDTGQVKGTVSPTVVRPGPSSRPASDHRHTPPSRPAETRSVDDCSATQLDSLFRPLPKNLSVFEQMCIWLERHHRNYFVGYTPAELAQLDDHLRPQMFVTKEVFEKNVSESMMDVLGKVETIMRCDDPWARAYQEKLRGFDGGFVSFEEALTQAVILWATRQPSLSQTGATLYGKHDGVRTGSGSATETPTGTGSSSQHAVTRMSPSQLAGVIRTRPRYQTSNGDSSAIVATSVDSAQEGQTNNYAIPENNTKSSCERDTPTVALNSRTPEETGCSRTKNVVADAHARHVSSPIDALWRCRDALRTACADDPCRSWQERLQPCLPILRHTLGADYRCPERLSDCMVDLFLATIHQRLVASEVGGQQADS